MVIRANIQPEGVELASFGITNFKNSSAKILIIIKILADE